jgi:hypothetical protein
MVLQGPTGLQVQTAPQELTEQVVL